MEGEPQGPNSDRLDARALELLRAIALRVEIGRRLVGEPTKALLRSIVEAAVALFRAEAASIALYDPVADRLVIEVAAGPQGAAAVGLSMAPSTGLAGYVFTTGQAIAQRDVERDSRFGREIAGQTGYVPRSLVAVPLVDDQGSIGVLEVLDKLESDAFSLRDIELAAVFAHQAAVAITSSRIERDTARLLASALRTLLTPEDVTAATDASGTDASGTEAAAGGAGDWADRIAAAASATLDDEDDRLWSLVEQVARARAADPAQLDLVTDILAVLARHAGARRPPVQTTRA